MAKSKKTRNKKYDPQHAHAKSARIVVENSLSRIAFIGASNRRIQPYGGRGFQYTVSRPLRVTVSAALAETLFEDSRDWRLWMAHFAQNEAGELEVESSALTLDEYTLTDFTEHIMTLVDHTMPDSMRDNPEYVGYAFFASPNERYDFAGDLADSRLVENFIASGVLEKDRHLPEHVLKVSKEELIIMLMADHSKFGTSLLDPELEVDDYKMASAEVV